MSKEEIIQRIRDNADELRRMFHVRQLALFGSAARDERGAESDIDILVDFKGSANFDDYMGLRLFLEDLLGMCVDLVTRDALRPELKESIEKQAVYVA